ncbi:MAG: hypothetical protein ABSG72_04620, partial [Candidatus Sulfotelmatobacter sp.]
MKRQISLVTYFAVLAFVFGVVYSARSGAQTAPVKPLTIDSMFQPGGLGGRGPETTEWSPDGTKLTF